MAAGAVVLALDVGTSSCRASLYDMRGRAVAGHAAQMQYAPTVTPDGGAELDPRWLLEQVFAAIDRVLAHQSAAIVAVATTTFWHSLLGLDAHGQPCTPIYPWLDARSRAQAAELRNQLEVREVHARTGCVLHWSYWPAKLRWLQQTQARMYRQVHRWVGFGEWLLEQTTGQIGASVSMASGTGLLDIHSCRWDDPLVGALEIDRASLPRLVALTKTAPTTAGLAARWPSLANVPWLPAIGDGASSNLGAGCATPAHVALMIGTSGAERVVWSPPEGNFRMAWGTWGYRLDERRLVIGGALNDGGALANWLRHTLRVPAPASLERAVSALEPDAHGLTVLPFWGGERSPGWADDARGAIVGLRLHTSPAEIQRACMEAVALRFGEIDRLVRAAMADTRDVIATGGALLHSPAWMQMLADVLGRPVLASAEPEASSRGAAVLALETLGHLRQPLEAQPPATRRRFEPNPAHTRIYHAAAERQRRLYDALVT